MEREIEVTAGTIGWVKLYRDIMENDVWQDKPFARGQAWVDLIMLANHKDKEFWLGASCLCTKRGQFVTSKRKLGERWGWSVKKVTKFLGELEKADMISMICDHRKTTISVINYDKYQQGNTEETVRKQQGNTEETVWKQSGNSKETVRKQQGNTEETQGKQYGNTEETLRKTNKKNKNIKEDKEGEKREEEPAALPPSETDDLALGFSWDEVEAE